MDLENQRIFPAEKRQKCTASHKASAFSSPTNATLGEWRAGSVVRTNREVGDEIGKDEEEEQEDPEELFGGGGGVIWVRKGLTQGGVKYQNDLESESRISATIANASSLPLADEMHGDSGANGGTL